MFVFNSIFIIVLATFHQVSAVNVVCYFSSSNGYQAAPPENLDANLCTHINYAFVSLLGNGSLTYANEPLDITLNMYGRVVGLKENNPDLKVLLSVGGVSTSIFAQVAANETSRKVFARSARHFMETYKFDGIDIDWEFPTAIHKEDFTSLLTDLRDNFGSEFLITAALAAIPKTGYDIPKLSEILDYINVMSYDFYGAWSEYTGQTSALFPASIESSYEKAYLNIAATAKNWVKGGAAPNKLNVGVAFYGRQFTLQDPSVHGLHAPITGAGTRVSATYSLICQNYANWTRVWDEEQKNPYKYLNDQWIGYDDLESIRLKALYILKMEYAGIMIWQIGSDDVFGKCGEKQGLLSVINKQVKMYKLRKSRKRS